MREIVLDTETTGLDFKEDRIVEIGCIELLDKMPTGNQIQFYVNPEKNMSEGASKISGLTDEFLNDKPLFSEIAYDLLEFLQDSPIVAHNAEFDIKFLNKELNLINKQPLENNIIDSLKIAREIFPNKKNNLDALCKRLKVNNTHRTFHGALLDAELTSQVYFILHHLQAQNQEFQFEQHKEQLKTNTIFPERVFVVSEQDIEKHHEIMKKIKKH